MHSNTCCDKVHKWHTKCTTGAVIAPVFCRFFRHYIMINESNIGHIDDFFVKLSKKKKDCCFLKYFGVII